MADRPAQHRYWLHAVLFLVTCVTTTWAGLLYVGPEAAEFLMGGEGLEPGGIDVEHWWRGFAFSGTLLGILLTHEMGHFIAARRHHVDVSLPYFIPLPVGLGTLGAVIAMREKIRARNALMDVGAAGPLAGLVVAIPLLVIGLVLSDVEIIPLGEPVFSEGNSLLYLGLKLAVFGEVLPRGGRDVFLHPMAFAAWCGLLVTMINLIPVGQLDGGHVAFAFFGDRYEWASRWFHRLLPVVGVGVAIWVFWTALHTVTPPPEDAPALWLKTPGEALGAALEAAAPWFIWPLMLLLLRGGGRKGQSHPDVGLEPLGRGRRAVGILVMIIFILILTPVPMRTG
jgi:membrane-associated protease RseP (regulator of RpoE activity)